MRPFFRLKLVVVGCAMGSAVLTAIQVLLGVDAALAPYTAAIGGVTGGIITLCLTVEAEK